jgi:Flp pilus assembly protein TadB
MPIGIMVGGFLVAFLCSKAGTAIGNHDNILAWLAALIPLLLALASAVGAVLASGASIPAFFILAFLVPALALMALRKGNTSILSLVLPGILLYAASLTIGAGMVLVLIRSLQELIRELAVSGNWMLIIIAPMLLGGAGYQVRGIILVF